MFAYRPAALVVVLAALVALAGCTEMRKEWWRDREKAPYVPTPMSYVDRMLMLAQPGPDDVIYDLGSGDGRIPIRAAEKYDVKKGVGLDIDADLVKLSNENAKKAGVADRVKFVQADVFKADFSDASIVTLYLLPEMNLRLRPRLLSELKPGTRIVAHRFNLGDWPPDRSILADETAPKPLNWTEEDRHHLLLYIVPARVAGLWRWSTGTGTRFGLRLDQRFQMLGGAVDIGRGPVAITGGKIEGERIQFDVEDRENGRRVHVRFEGTVAGDTIRGTVDVDGKKVPFTATRAS